MNIVELLDYTISNWTLNIRQLFSGIIKLTQVKLAKMPICDIVIYIVIHKSFYMRRRCNVMKHGISLYFHISFIKSLKLLFDRNNILQEDE